MKAPRTDYSDRQIKHNPPPGSRLASYVQYLDGTSSPDDLDLWWRYLKSHVYEERVTGAITLLTYGIRHDELPRSIVRELFVIPPLVEQGMPKDVPAWADHLVEMSTDELLRFCGGKSSLAVFPNKRRSTVQRVILAAYFQVAPLASENARFEAVVERLGRGLDDDHIRNVVKPFMREMGALSADPRRKPWADLAVKHIMFVAECLTDLDENFDLVRKPGALTKVFVHKQTDDAGLPPQRRPT